MKFDDDIMSAILFYVINTEINIPVYFPVRPLLGRINGEVFTDILTGKKILSPNKMIGVNGEECYAILTDIPTLLKDTEESSYEKAISKLWSNVEGKSFVYGSFYENLEDPLMLSLDDQEFVNIFGYSLLEESIEINTRNEILEKYIDGKISREDYEYFLNNGNLPNKTKCKILNVDFREKDKR